MEDCAKTIEKGRNECKDMMDAFKKSYVEKEKNEKAENAARFAALELTIETQKKECKDLMDACKKSYDTGELFNFGE